jgi:hypothetical protein
MTSANQCAPRYKRVTATASTPATTVPAS